MSIIKKIRGDNAGLQNQAMNLLIRIEPWLIEAIRKASAVDRPDLKAVLSDLRSTLGGKVQVIKKTEIDPEELPEEEDSPEAVTIDYGAMEARIDMPPGLSAIQAIEETGRGTYRIVTSANMSTWDDDDSSF